MAGENNVGGVNRVPQAGVISGSVSLEGQKQTYRAAKQALSLHATPNIVSMIKGSATKTVRVIGLRVSGAAAVASQVIPYVVEKQSSAPSGGTHTEPTCVPNDSANGAATAVVSNYTVDPTTGTVVGPIAARTVSCNLATVASGNAPSMVDFISVFGQGLVLRGVAEAAAVNLAGVTLAQATILNIEWEWTEE